MGRDKCVPSVQKDGALPGSQPKIPRIDTKAANAGSALLVSIFLLAGSQGLQ